MKSVCLSIVSLMMASLAIAAKPLPFPEDIKLWDCGHLKSPVGTISKSSPWLSVIYREEKHKQAIYVKESYLGRDKYQPLATVSSSPNLRIQQSKDYELILQVTPMKTTIKSKLNPRMQTLCSPETD